MTNQFKVGGQRSSTLVYLRKRRNNPTHHFVNMNLLSNSNCVKMTKNKQESLQNIRSTTIPFETVVGLKGGTFYLRPKLEPKENKQSEKQTTLPFSQKEMVTHSKDIVKKDSAKYKTNKTERNIRLNL